MHLASTWPQSKYENEEIPSRLPLIFEESWNLKYKDMYTNITIIHRSIMLDLQRNILALHLNNYYVIIFREIIIIDRFHVRRTLAPK